MIVLEDNEDRAIARVVRSRRAAARPVTNTCSSMILLCDIITTFPSPGRMAGMRAAAAVRDLIRYAPRDQVGIELGMFVAFPATTLTTDIQLFPQGGIYLVGRRLNEECSVDLVDPRRFLCVAHRICYLEFS